LDCGDKSRGVSIKKGEGGWHREVPNFIVLTLPNIFSSELWSEIILPTWIPDSEKQQISEKIPIFVESVLANEILFSSVTDLSEKMVKPLRGVYINPHFSSEKISDFKNLPFSPILCISASFLQKETEMEYIQGAADDHETWSMGLEASMFWENKHFLMASEFQIEERIKSLVENTKLGNNSISNPEQLCELTPEELQHRFYFLGETGIAVGTDVEGTIGI